MTDVWIVDIGATFHFYVDAATAQRVQDEMDRPQHVVRFEDLGRAPMAVRAEAIRAVWLSTPESRAMDAAIVEALWGDNDNTVGWRE